MCQLDITCGREASRLWCAQNGLGGTIYCGCGTSTQMREISLPDGLIGDPCQAALEYCPYGDSDGKPATVAEGVEVVACVAGEVVNCGRGMGSDFECNCNGTNYVVSDTEGWDACAIMLPFCSATPPGFTGEPSCESSSTDANFACKLTDACERRTSVAANVAAVERETREGYCSYSAASDVWDCSCSSATRALTHFALTPANVGEPSCDLAEAACTSAVFELGETTCGTGSVTNRTDACELIEACSIPATTDIGEIEIQSSYGVLCSLSSPGKWNCACYGVGQMVQSTIETETDACAAVAPDCSYLALANVKNGLYKAAK